MVLPMVLGSTWFLTDCSQFSQIDRTGGQFLVQLVGPISPVWFLKP